MTNITLTNARSTWKGKLRTWYEFLTFAERYGWKPAGTLKPRGDATRGKWDGDYKLPIGQVVSTEDARALSKALRFALVATSTFVVGAARTELLTFARFCSNGEFELVSLAKRTDRRVSLPDDL